MVHKGSLGSATLGSIPLQDSCGKEDAGCTAVCSRFRTSAASCVACDLTASLTFASEKHVFGGSQGHLAPFSILGSVRRPGRTHGASFTSNKAVRERKL